MNKEKKKMWSNLTNQTTKEDNVFKSHSGKRIAIIHIHIYTVLYEYYDLIFDIKLFEMIILILSIFIQALKVM